MEKIIVLYNSISDNSKGLENAKKIEEKFANNEYEFVDLLKIENFSKFFNEYKKDQKFILCGGDGTLNHF